MAALFCNMLLTTEVLAPFHTALLTPFALALHEHVPLHYDIQR
jgi:hypothetical protein